MRTEMKKKAIEGLENKNEENSHKVEKKEKMEKERFMPVDTLSKLKDLEMKN